MTDLTPIPPQRLSIAYSATAEMTIELAKMLALVAPISMTVEQQELWLRAAVDSLEDIRPQEVVAISAELRRSVTRPSQIVPEIARLVAEKRKRLTTHASSDRPCACGAGTAAATRTDVHWVERDKRQTIEWCGAPASQLTELHS